MSALAGILGAAGLFALMGFAATRTDSRLEETEGCGDGTCDLHGAPVGKACEGCGEKKSSGGWWPVEGTTYGESR